MEGGEIFFLIEVGFEIVETRFVRSLHVTRENVYVCPAPSVSKDGRREVLGLDGAREAERAALEEGAPPELVPFTCSLQTPSP